VGVTEELTHNPRNAVTHSIERISLDGRSAVRKVLNGLNHPDTPPEWIASDEPRHWNYWQRESFFYQSHIRKTLASIGVSIPKLLQIEEGEYQIELILDDIQGRSGTALTLEDYALASFKWGQAQAHLSRTEWMSPWASCGFLRDYAASKPVNYQLLYEDKAWTRPLIADNWPRHLRDQVISLYENRSILYSIVEASTRVPSHLDFWPNNVFVDTAGDLVPIDWSFYGEGSYGEDIASFIPETVFDDFIVPDLLPKLEHDLFSAYIEGLVAGGDTVNETEVKMTFHACAVKYVWLAPLLLEKAGEPVQRQYGGAQLADANRQYQNRGLALSFLCGWASSAIKAQRALG